MPQFAVIFSSQLHQNTEDYAKISQEIENLVKNQPGYISHFSFRNESGQGVTISYWDNMESISRWKQNDRHRYAQTQGQLQFYKSYRIQICEVIKDYSFNS